MKADTCSLAEAAPPQRKLWLGPTINMTGYFLGKIIPMIPDDAMEFTISPLATVNHGRLLP